MSLSTQQNRPPVSHGHVEETITNSVAGAASYAGVMVNTNITITRTYTEKIAYVRLENVLVNVATDSGFIVDSLKVSSGQSAPHSAKSVETSTSNKKHYSFVPNWGNVFDDGGVGNTVIGTHVKISVRRQNSSKCYNLTITNQLYSTEVIDENGRIKQPVDMSAVLEEALMRGERD